MCDNNYDVCVLVTAVMAMLLRVIRDGSRKLLCNVGQNLPDDMVQHMRRQCLHKHNIINNKFGHKLPIVFSSF